MNRKKGIFYTVIESIPNYVWEIWTVDYKLKKKILNEEMDYWRRAARTSRRLQGRNKVIREKMRVRQTIKGRMENNMLQLYGHVVCMENSRWPKRIMIWSSGGRRR